MRNGPKYALLFAVVSIFLRFIYYVTGLSLEYPLISGMTYLLCLLLAVFLTIHFYKERQLKSGERMPFVSDLKETFKSAVVFSIIVGVYTYFHYNSVDPVFFEAKIAEQIELAKQADLKKLAESNPQLSNLTREDVINKAKESTEFMFNAFNHATLTLFFFMIIGGVYSALITAVVRKLRKF